MPEYTQEIQDKMIKLRQEGLSMRLIGEQVELSRQQVSAFINDNTSLGGYQERNSPDVIPVGEFSKLSPLALSQKYDVPIRKVYAQKRKIQVRRDKTINLPKRQEDLIIALFGEGHKPGSQFIEVFTELLQKHKLGSNYNDVMMSFYVEGNKSVKHGKAKRFNARKNLKGVIDTEYTLIDLLNANFIELT